MSFTTEAPAENLTNLTNLTNATAWFVWGAKGNNITLNGLSSIDESLLPPPGTGLDEIVEKEPFRVPQGIWIWLVFIVPMFCVILIFWLWVRLKEPVEQEPVTKQIGQTTDQFGQYNTVRPIPLWEKASKKRPTVFLDVAEMPQMRPLGVELQELKVIRVHSAGARFGWMVGDKIVSIAGQPVLTFEELWDRIQNERDRLPVRFIVERGEEKIDPITEELDRLQARQAKQVASRRSHAAVAQSPVEPDAGQAKPAQQGARSRVAPSPVELEVAKLRPPPEAWAPKSGGTMSPKGLPSALVGWETWAAPVGSEEVVEDRSARANIAKKAGVNRTQLGTTRFMRTFPLTDGEKLKQTLKRPTDVDAKEVRFKRDGWGRSVIQVGDQGRSIISVEG